MKAKYSYPILVVIVILAAILASCAAQKSEENVTASVPTPTDLDADVPVHDWSSLLQVEPAPYASPLPPADKTALDGTYANFDPAPPQWWLCLRCADYRQAGGAWRLQFDRGVMRIYYEVTGWHSLASYTVSDDHLYLFNDPYCKEVTGEYRWKLADGKLSLEAVDDTCSFQLRGKNLSEGAWAACPADEAIDVEKPRGCTDAMVESVVTPPLPEGLNLRVYQADVRISQPSPDAFVNASGTDQSLPKGIRFSYSDESLPYGTNRVLWTDDDWMEFVTEEPFTSIGVQFRGDYVIGWARVLFDGEEVWRGDTSKIWSKEKIHGGYIEVSGFEPGEHTLRVERLTVDSRPVIVAFFGFNR